LELLPEVAYAIVELPGMTDASRTPEARVFSTAPSVEIRSSSPEAEMKNSVWPSAVQPTARPEVLGTDRSPVIWGGAGGLGLGFGVGLGAGRGVVFTATTAAWPIFTPGAVFASAATVTWYWVLGASSPEAGWMTRLLPCQV